MSQLIKSDLIYFPLKITQNIAINIVTPGNKSKYTPKKLLLDI